MQAPPFTRPQNEAMPTSVAQSNTRERITRGLLWISVLAWGMLLGATLFDLRVLAGAWSASPPESLSLLPYGKRWPVDTGEFFIPSSAALLLASFGALVAGWRSGPRYRALLFVSAATIFAVLVFTVLVFWPMNAALWAVARGSATALKDPEAVRALVQKWIALDWLRLGVGVLGYVAAIKAISIPYPATIDDRPSSPLMKAVYAVCLAGVLAFVAYFVSEV